MLRKTIWYFIVWIITLNLILIAVTALLDRLEFNVNPDNIAPLILIASIVIIIAIRKLISLTEGTIKPQPVRKNYSFYDDDEESEGARSVTKQGFKMNFVSIDVETANADLASICQIGAAKFQDGVLVAEFSALIDPEDFFDFINVSIHGINEQDVQGKPTFSEIANDLLAFIGDSICACHTSFDKTSLRRAFNKYSLPQPDILWIDTARVTRRTWPEFSQRGYGLANVCKKIGYEFQHHDALEDAKACGQILLAAVEHSGISIDDWVTQANRRMPSYQRQYSPEEKPDANLDGYLFGEVIAFTGALEIPRKEAAAMAAELGCTVGSGVTKKTTLLVIGDQDLARLAGKEKSAKHLKAEELIASGQAIRILKESDFSQLLST